MIWKQKKANGCYVLVREPDARIWVFDECLNGWLHERREGKCWAESKRDFLCSTLVVENLGVRKVLMAMLVPTS